jgi:hypothetical protein
MPRYKVSLNECATYDVEVEAENEDQAAEKAEERFVNEGATKFPVQVHDREAANIEEITTPTEAEPAAPDSVRTFLDLSTGHLKLSTRNAIDAHEVDCIVYPHPSGFGWLIYVQDDEEARDKEVPADLRACFDRARALGCAYLMLDADAPQDAELPYYGDGEKPEGEMDAFARMIEKAQEIAGCGPGEDDDLEINAKRSALDYPEELSKAGAS